MTRQTTLAIATSLLTVILVLACNSAGSTSAPPPDPVTLSGSGDNVLQVGHLDQHTTATITHDGSGHFLVLPFDQDNNRLISLVNEAGAYDGTVKWDQRAHTLQITADGNWTIIVK